MLVEKLSRSAAFHFYGRLNHDSTLSGGAKRANREIRKIREKMKIKLNEILLELQSFIRLDIDSENELLDFI